MEQTPQPCDQKKNQVKENSGACPQKNPVEQDAHAEKHVVSSEKVIDINDEDRALDSGI